MDKEGEDKMKGKFLTCIFMVLLNLSCARTLDQVELKKQFVGKWEIPLEYFSELSSSQKKMKIELIFYDDNRVSIKNAPANVFLSIREDNQLVDLLGTWEFLQMSIDRQQIDVALRKVNMPLNSGVVSTIMFNRPLFSNKFQFYIMTVGEQYIYFKKQDSPVLPKKSSVTNVEEILDREPIGD